MQYTQPINTKDTLQMIYTGFAIIMHVNKSIPPISEIIASFRVTVPDISEVVLFRLRNYFLNSKDFADFKVQVSRDNVIPVLKYHTEIGDTPPTTLDFYTM